VKGRILKHEEVTDEEMMCSGTMSEEKGRDPESPATETEQLQDQKPDGVNTFMSRGLSLCGRGGGIDLASIPVISILGGMKLAGSSTFSLTCVLE